MGRVGDRNRERTKVDVIERDRVRVDERVRVGKRDGGRERVRKKWGYNDKMKADIERERMRGGREGERLR